MKRTVKFVVCFLLGGRRAGAAGEEAVAVEQWSGDGRRGGRRGGRQLLGEEIAAGR